MEIVDLLEEFKLTEQYRQMRAFQETLARSEEATALEPMSNWLVEMPLKEYAKGMAMGLRADPIQALIDKLKAEIVSKRKKEGTKDE